MYLLNFSSSDFIDNLQFLVNDYMKVSSEYNLKAINTTGIEREDLQKKASSFQRIVDKLLNLNFKKQIME